MRDYASQGGSIGGNGCLGRVDGVAVNRNDVEHGAASLQDRREPVVGAGLIFP